MINILCLASGMQHPHQMQGHPMMMAQPMPPQQLAQQTMPPPVAQVLSR